MPFFGLHEFTLGTLQCLQRAFQLMVDTFKVLRALFDALLQELVQFDDPPVLHQQTVGNRQTDQRPHDQNRQKTVVSIT